VSELCPPPPGGFFRGETGAFFDVVVLPRLFGRSRKGCGRFDFAWVDGRAELADGWPDRGGFRGDVVA
jgi:hypothetical protein